MSEQSGFLDGKYYDAKFLYTYTKKLVGNGVYADELAPTATNGDMSVTLGPGFAWVEGVLYYNDTAQALEVAQADGALNRIDSLMVRLDLSKNDVNAIIVQGAYASAPVAPTVTRNAEVYDLKICNISVPAGCTEITQAQITDTRLDTAVCGMPVFPVEHLNTAALYAQIVKDLENFRSQQQKSFADWTEHQEASTLEALADLVDTVRTASGNSTGEIETLLQQLNELVSGDPVGILLARINATDENLAATALARARLYSCQLTVEGWTDREGGGFQQTVECEGLTENTTGAPPFILPTFDPETDEPAAEALALIAGGTTAEGSATFYCLEEKPETAITVYFLGVN